MKTAEHIIETVDKLVRKYHTRDPYELCQLLGIKIHYYDLQKKLKGFFYYQSRQKNIVIDHNVNGILERILVAHELGHAVLHTKIAMMHGFQAVSYTHLDVYKRQDFTPSDWLEISKSFDFWWTLQVQVNVTM